LPGISPRPEEIYEHGTTSLLLKSTIETESNPLFLTPSNATCNQISSSLRQEKTKSA
jgi:hypothetical protein